MNTDHSKISTPALQQKAEHLRAIIRLDGADIQARRDLLVVNAEIARRRKAREIIHQPIMPRL